MRLLLIGLAIGVIVYVATSGRVIFLPLIIPPARLALPPPEALPAPQTRPHYETKQLFAASSSART